MLLLHCLKFWMRWFNRNFRNRLQHLVEIAILDIFYARFKFSVQLLSIAVIGFGVWMSTHHDGCRKALTIPVLGLGAVIFLM